MATNALFLWVHGAAQGARKNSILRSFYQILFLFYTLIKNTGALWGFKGGFARREN